jgi:hypothetical protein
MDNTNMQIGTGSTSRKRPREGETESQRILRPLPVEMNQDMYMWLIRQRGLRWATSKFPLSSRQDEFQQVSHLDLKDGVSPVAGLKQISQILVQPEH